MTNSNAGMFHIERAAFQKMMRVDDVAELMDVKVSTIRKFILKGEIPCVKIGSSVRFVPGELAAWIESRKVGGKRAAPSCENTR